MFDALIGNKDRHFYNWGVIYDLNQNKMPRFSPVFDTARGVFWNDAEDKLIRVLEDAKTTDNFIAGYIKKSIPKTGWDGEVKINHIELVQYLRIHYKPLTIRAESLFEEKHIEGIKRLLKDEFTPLLTVERLQLIEKCLVSRFQLIR